MTEREDMPAILRRISSHQITHERAAVVIEELAAQLENANKVAAEFQTRFLAERKAREAIIQSHTVITDERNKAEDRLREGEAATIEQCAKVCDGYLPGYSGSKIADNCAAAIRALAPDRTAAAQEQNEGEKIRSAEEDIERFAKPFVSAVPTLGLHEGEQS